MGISGLDAAQWPLGVTGANAARLAAKGAGAQDADLRAADEASAREWMLGQGVDAIGARGRVDRFLEAESERQQDSLASLQRRFDALSAIEDAMNEADLGVSLDRFSASLDALSRNPEDPGRRAAMLASAESLMTRVDSVGAVIGGLQEGFRTEAQGVTAQINDASPRIARLSHEAHEQQARGRDAGRLAEQRDRLIADLGSLVGLFAEERQDAAVDVTAARTPLVTGFAAERVRVGLVEEDGVVRIGLGAEGSETYDTSVAGGRLGELFELHNSVVGDIRRQFERFAGIVASQVSGADGSPSGLAETSGDVNLKDTWQQLAGDVARQRFATELEYENGEAVMRDLDAQRDATGGGDVGEQAGRMMIREGLFRDLAGTMNSMARTQDTFASLLQ